MKWLLTFHCGMYAELFCILNQQVDFNSHYFLARLVLEEFARRFDLPDCKPVRNRIVNCRNQRKENLKIKRKEIDINI